METSKMFFFMALLTFPQPKPVNNLRMLYIGWQNKEIYKFGVTPNKLFEYMAAGKPVIQALSHAENLVSKAGAGIACEAENHEAIIEAFNEILRRPESERIAMGERGKKFVIENYAYVTLADKFLSFIHQLTHKGHDAKHG